MKKNLKFIVLFIVLILCDLFFINNRSEIKSLEQDSNSAYLDYESNRNDYKITTGRITDIMEPMGEHSLAEDPLKWTGGTLPWTCYIEFETDDGQTVKGDKYFFPADPKNDSIGKTVGIAYYNRTDLKGSLYVARTEYVSSFRKYLNQNMIWIAVLSTASVAVLAFIVVKTLRGE